MLEMNFIPTILIDILTLTGLEIILGIDNLIFITLLVQKLEAKSRYRAQILGLLFTLLVRIIILTFFTELVSMTSPLFSIASTQFSIKSCLFILGGSFLILKSAMDIIEMFFEASGKRNLAMRQVTIISPKVKYNKIFGQIILISILLSLDSVMAGISLSKNIYAIATAIIISVSIIILMSRKIARFVYKYSSFRIIALLFVILLGVHMLLTSIDMQFPKAYLYWASAFSIICETVNIKLNKLKNRNIYKKT